jgi:toxin secretion/phage lysis holin
MERRYSMTKILEPISNVAAKTLNPISVVIGVVGGTIAQWIEGWDVLAQTLLALMAIDILTGLIKSIIQKRLSTNIHFVGIAKKALMWIIVCLACILQGFIGEAIPLRDITIFLYISNEGLSILENVAAVDNGLIPQKIKDVLLQLRDKSTAAGTETVDKEDK